MIKSLGLILSLYVCIYIYIYIHICLFSYVSMYERDVLVDTYMFDNAMILFVYYMLGINFALRRTHMAAYY